MVRWVGAAAGQGNLVANPGFEEGGARPSAWTFWSGNADFGAVVTDGAPRTGRRCARLDSRSTHYGHYLMQDVPVPRPGRYRVAAWVRLGGGVVSLTAVGSASGSGASFSEGRELCSYRGHPLVPHFVPLEDTSGVRDLFWHSLQFVVDVPAGVSSARIQIGLTFTPGRVWVDDVSMEAADRVERDSPPPEPSGAVFAREEAGLSAEDPSARRARIGLPGARARTRAGGEGAQPLAGRPYRPEAGSPPPYLTVRDGKRLGTAPCLPPDVRGWPGRWLIRRRFRDGSGEVAEEVSARAGYTSWRVIIHSRARAEKWLELELAVPTSLGRSAAFWDGAEETPVEQGWRERQGAIFAFPVACVYDRQQGVAVGIAPFRDHSYVARGIRERRGHVEMYSIVRMVVEPGTAQTVDFVAYRFAPRWAWREAVQVYYDAFPGFAWPTPGTDPRLVGTDGYAFASMETRHLQMEECRRFHIGWEWVYAPLQTPGDWYPDERHWDPRKGFSGTSDLHHNEVPGTLADYRRATRDRFHRGHNACAMLFYVIPQACEKAFLEKEYPDSWWIRADGSRALNARGYVKADDDTALAWPLSTSYGRATLDDLRRIAADFRPSGFAFACAHGFAEYYGPTQKGAPGRAWGNGRTYLLESVALGALMDAIHRMSANGQRLGVCSNGPYTYMVGRRSDVVLFEPAAFHWRDYFSRQWPVRLLSGRKLVTWHTGHAAVSDLVRWQELPPEAVGRAVRGAVDFTLLWSLWLGAAPSAPDVRGVPRVARWMPMLLELARAGWQPVPALEADESLLASRYGHGTGSFLALSNPTRQTVRGSARVHEVYLGHGAHLACRYDGSPLPCESDGEWLRFGYALAPHEALVLRTPVAVHGGGAILGFVAMDPQPLRSGKLVAEFAARKPSVASLQLQLPPRVAVMAATLNGHRLRLSARRGALVAHAPLGRWNRMVVRYEPAVRLDSPAAEVRGYPLIREGRADCVIVTARSAGARDRVSAERLAAYVEYYLRHQGRPGASCWDLTGGPADVRPKLLSSADPLPGLPGVVLVGQPAGFGLGRSVVLPRGHGTIRLVTWRGRKALLVAGADSQRTEEAVARLMGLLDRRYVFWGALPDNDFYRRAGLAGGVLTAAEQDLP